MLGSFTSHDLIYGSYAINMHQSTSEQIKYVRNFSRINNTKLLESAHSLNWDFLFTTPVINEQVEHLTNNISFLLNKFAPLQKLKLPLDRKPEWLNENLQKLINVRNFAHNSLRLERCETNRLALKTEFRRLRNEVNSLKRRLKVKFYETKLNVKLLPKVLWKNIRNLGVSEARIDPSINFSATEFNDYFASVFTESSIENLDFDQINDKDSDFSFITVSCEDVLAAIAAISTNALGDDEIPAIFLKKLCPIILPFVTHVINQCITKSYFPIQWKVAIVTPIPKEPVPSSVSDFRPISILPSLSKVLEHIMKDQMKFFIHSRKMLTHIQSGFRSAHSPQTAMLKVTDDISKAMDSIKITLMVFLDFKKAFDLVDHKKLLIKLRNKFEFSALSCQLIKSYLSDRVQKVQINDDSSDFVSVTSGTPQGGKISDLLFSLFINDLPEVVDIDVHLYADDSQFYCSFLPNQLSEGICKMNNAMKNVESWASLNSIVVNPSKSKCMVISKTKVIPSPAILFANNLITHVESHKTLGLILSNDLSWKAHVIKICNETVASLCSLRHTQYITPQSTKFRLVQALLIPKLLYCSNVFIGCQRSSWDELNKVFNSCLRFIFNIRKSESVTCFKTSLLGCSLEHFFHFQACLFIHNILRKKSPSYLYDKLHFPRIQRSKLLNLPPFKSKIRQDSFFVLGIRLWNSLSSNLRSIESTSVFRRECLAYFASKTA